MVGDGPTRVLIYCDEPVFAAGLCHVLASEPTFELPGICASAAALLRTCTRVQPGILIWDWSGAPRLGDILNLQRRCPGCRIVLLVRGFPPDLARKAVEQGVQGVLGKQRPAETVLRCLRVVAAGGLWLDETFSPRDNEPARLFLSKRERQLIQSLSRGMRNKDVAAELFLSEGSVKVYISRLFRKLGVKDRFELALYGLKEVAEADEVTGQLLELGVQTGGRTWKRGRPPGPGLPSSSRGQRCDRFAACPRSQA